MNRKRVSEDEKTRRELLAAHLHYSKGINKTEISNLLEVSITEVGRLLKGAMVSGFIRVHYSPPQMRELELHLVDKFKLQEAIVIPAVRDMTAMRHLLAHKAAEYFENSIKHHKRVAIGGGITLYQMVHELSIRDRDVEILPSAIVGKGPTLHHIDPLTLVSLLWIKSGHKPNQAYSVTVPPIETGTSMEQAKIDSDSLLTRAKIRAVFEEMKTVDSVFVSIGSLVDEEHDHENPGMINLLKEIDMSDHQLRDSHVVGDINYSYFDENGETRDEWSFCVFRPR